MELKINRVRDEQLIKKIEEFNENNKELYIYYNDTNPSVFTHYEVWRVEEESDKTSIVAIIDINKFFFRHRDEYISFESLYNLAEFVKWFDTTYTPIYEKMVQDNIDAADESWTGMVGDR